MNSLLTFDSEDMREANSSAWLGSISTAQLLVLSPVLADRIGIVLTISSLILLSFINTLLLGVSSFHSAGELPRLPVDE